MSTIQRMWLMACMVAFYHQTARSSSSLELFRHMSTKAKAMASPVNAPPARLLIHCGDADWVVETFPGQQASVATCGNAGRTDDRCSSLTSEGVEITVAPDALKLILQHKLSPISAVMQKKLTIEGNRALLSSESLRYLWDIWHIPTESKVGVARSSSAIDILKDMLHALVKSLVKSGKGLLTKILQICRIAAQGVKRGRAMNKYLPHPLKIVHIWMWEGPRALRVSRL